MQEPESKWRRIRSTKSNYFHISIYFSLFKLFELKGKWYIPQHYLDIVNFFGKINGFAKIESIISILHLGIIRIILRTLTLVQKIYFFFNSSNQTYYSIQKKR